MVKTGKNRPGKNRFWTAKSGQNLSKTYFFRDGFFRFLPWFFPPPGKNRRTRGGQGGKKSLDQDGKMVYQLSEWGWENDRQRWENDHFEEWEKGLVGK